MRYQDALNSDTFCFCSHSLHALRTGCNDPSFMRRALSGNGQLRRTERKTLLTEGKCRGETIHLSFLLRNMLEAQENV